MSLPARQQRVLDRIEHSLHVCEPHLTSMFAVFTTLTGDEEMPRLEQLRPRSLPVPGWRKRPARPGRKEQTVSGAGATGAAGARLRALLLIPVMAAGAGTRRPVRPRPTQPEPMRAGDPAAAYRGCAEPAQDLLAEVPGSRAPTAAERMTSPARAGTHNRRG